MSQRDRQRARKRSVHQQEERSRQRQRNIERHLVTVLRTLFGRNVTSVEALAQAGLAVRDLIDVYGLTAEDIAAWAPSTDVVGDVHRLYDIGRALLRAEPDADQE